MNRPSSRSPRSGILPTALIFAVSSLSTITTRAAATSELLDDFSAVRRTSKGAERLLIDDKSVNGQSQATQTCADGVLTVKGELVPARGMFAFLSLVLFVSSDSQPQDLSAFEGIRLRVKINQGSLSVQACSADVQNFDYHFSAVARKSAEFEEIRVPFKDMKRAWSEQTALNLKTITSINLVAAGMAKGDFAYEVDEIGFY